MTSPPSCARQATQYDTRTERRGRHVTKADMLDWVLSRWRVVVILVSRYLNASASPRRHRESRALLYAGKPNFTLGLDTQSTAVKKKEKRKKEKKKNHSPGSQKRQTAELHVRRAGPICRLSSRTKKDTQPRNTANRGPETEAPQIINIHGDSRALSVLSSYKYVTSTSHPPLEVKHSFWSALSSSSTL